MKQCSDICEPECVPRGRIKATPEHVAAFKALAHPDRLRTFFFPVQKKEPTAANEIQRALKLPGPTLSHHLDQLERAGLIDRQRQERFILSSIRREMVVDLVRILTACC